MAELTTELEAPVADSAAVDLSAIPRPVQGYGVAHPRPSERDYTSFGMLRSLWWRRVGSSTLDRIIVLIPTFILFVALTYDLQDQDQIDRYALYNAVAMFVVDGAYTVLMLSRGKGRTIGNLATGISVRDEDTGELLTARTAFLRWFTHSSLLTLFIPGLICDLWPLWDKKRQSLADRVAHTAVVREL